MIRIWKREFDAEIAHSCMGRQVTAIYAGSFLSIADVTDTTDSAQATAVPEFNLDELACRRAASAARERGLIQAWSISEGPQGFSAIAMCYDNQFVRVLAATLAEAMAWVLLDISKRRN